MFNRTSYLIYIVLLTIIMLTFSHELHAVPAAPAFRTLTQPDGTAFRARQWGDEFSHGWETAEGYSIVFDEHLKTWTYAELDWSGRLVSSFNRVGIDQLPPNISKHLLPEKELRPLIAQNAFPAELSPELPQEQIPLSGTANIPVILINFKDRSATFSGTDFNTLLFGSGNYSLKEYFTEVSYGSFTVTAGPGGVAGWYTAANNHDYYGQNDTGGADRWPGTLVREAVMAADAAGFNFAPYDQDGDGYVDVVAIVHQGSGAEAGGTSTDIWSHSWSLNGAYYYGYSDGGEYTTNDPHPQGGYIKVNKYIIQPESLSGGMQTIGVFAHEYGHALGLPDFYDTDYSSEGIGNWSIMAGGAWNSVSRPGDRPAHMDAWCKYALGWITPAIVSGTLTNEPISAAATNADVYQLLPGSPSSGGEYFLIENRQKSGFDAGLPGAGLLVWHIDESVSSNRNECYPGGPDCAVNHYHLSLMQADNLWDLEKKKNRGNQGDPYPGSTNNTSFTNNSSPNSNLWNEGASNVSITDISSSGSIMTATLSTDGTPVTTTLPATTTTQPGTSTSSSSTTTSQPSTTTIQLSTTTAQPITTSIQLTTTTSAAGTTSIQPTTTSQPGTTTTSEFSTTSSQASTTSSLINTTSILPATTTMPSSGGHGGGGSKKTTTSSLFPPSTSSTPPPVTTSTMLVSSSTTTSVKVTTTVASSSTTTTAKQCPIVLLADDQPERIDELRDFRDTILLKSRAGRGYVRLFYRHSLELTSILLKNPDITFQAREVLSSIFPHIKSSIETKEMHITPTMMHRIESLLDAINTAASFELKVTILRLKQDLSQHKMFEKLGIKFVFQDG